MYHINCNTTLYNVIFIGLTCNRDKLYAIINNRVDNMINQGLSNEIKSYYDRNINTKPLVNGIGYKELYKYFDNEIALDEAINLIKRNSRRYAKRQYTFFKHQFPVIWIDVNFNNFDNTVEEVMNKV